MISSLNASEYTVVTKIKQQYNAAVSRSVWFQASYNPYTVSGKTPSLETARFDSVVWLGSQLLMKRRTVVRVLFAARVDNAQPGEEKKELGAAEGKSRPTVISSQGTKGRFYRPDWLGWDKQQYCDQRQSVWWVWYLTGLLHCELIVSMATDCVDWELYVLIFKHVSNIFTKDRKRIFEKLH